MPYLLKYTLFFTLLVYIIHSQIMPVRQCLARQNARLPFVGQGLDRQADEYSLEAELNNPKEVFEDQEGVESEDQKWTGIDVSIVGKYAEKYGHPPRRPYINTDQGDLLLFAFTVAGVIGGIIIGYNIRKLFIEGNNYKKTDHEYTRSNTSFEQERNINEIQ
jgi:phage shock protein PspC (stress-responsive transcriptional regulator)